MVQPLSYFPLERQTSISLPELQSKKKLTRQRTEHYAKSSKQLRGCFGHLYTEQLIKNLSKRMATVVFLSIVGSRFSRRPMKTLIIIAVDHCLEIECQIVHVGDRWAANKDGLKQVKNSERNRRCGQWVLQAWITPNPTQVRCIGCLFARSHATGKRMFAADEQRLADILRKSRSPAVRIPFSCKGFGATRHKDDSDYCSISITLKLRVMWRSLPAPRR